MITTGIDVTNPWLPHTTTKTGESLRLFCFHHAGTGASMFRTWEDILPDDIAVYPIQLPGRETRLKEPLVRHAKQLVEEMVENLAPYLHQPFAFFGHSMGALLCFEFTRELRRRNLPLPLHLFVSAQQAPQLPVKRPFMHKLTDTQLVRTLLYIDETQREIMMDESLQALLLPIIRADFSVCETYICQEEAALPFPITAFGGQQDLRVTCDELEDWGLQTESAFNLHLLPGGHFYLQQNPKMLLRSIEKEIRQHTKRYTHRTVLSF